MNAKFTLAALLLLILAGALFSATVARIEYFFDTDPGPGNGTQLYSRDPVEVSQLISAASLSPGLHRILIRAKDTSGKWGIPQSQSFLVPAATQISGTISRIEYFFDSDPGPGNGTQIYSRNTINVTLLFSAAAFSPGLHALFVRTRNTAGKWGLPQRTAFYKPPQTQPHGTVSKVEYFFDADPGAGNGIQIYSRDPVTLDQLINSASLGPGIHRIFVRSKNTAGKWGLPQSVAFLVPVPTSAPVTVTKLEWFVDTDPGFGLGHVVNLTPASAVNTSFSIDMSGVEHGNHRLYLRGKNNRGQWGFPVYALFSDGVPAHLTIQIVGSNVLISWEDLYTIDTYKVYSGPEPYGAFTVDLSGTFGASDWTAPFTGLKNFYYVTSIYDAAK